LAIKQSSNQACSIFFVVLALSSCFDAFGIEGRDNPKADSFDRFISGTQPIQFIPIEIKNGRVGERRSITIFLQNSADQPVEFKSVSTSCACTIASVPLTSVLPGESERLDFEINLEPRPLSLSENFDISIQTEGAYQLIRIRFHVRYENLVTFGRKEYVHVYGADEINSTFSLPLRVSNIQQLRDASVVCTEGIANAIGAISTDKGSAKVNLQFAPHTFPNEDVAGEIRVQRKDEILATIYCLFQRRKSVEMFPKQLMLVASDEKPDKSVATAILYFRKNRDASTIQCQRVVCTADNQKPLAIECIRMGAGRFRLILSVDTRKDFPAKGTLNWKFETNEGNEVLTSEYVFIN
jgi:hypothetical protein